mmetsp:Transcript_52527/g.153019  ORF Transcript_52527/g.153019 Transcript_52527/m.153019 type:complete len:211 (-) Transcript_52527:934-1566(-)
MPPSQAEEHADQPVQKLTTQFCGQWFSLHRRCIFNGGHSAPFQAATITSLVACWVPPPQEALHSPPAHSVTWQSCGKSCFPACSQSWSRKRTRPHNFSCNSSSTSFSHWRLANRASSRRRRRSSSRSRRRSEKTFTRPVAWDIAADKSPFRRAMRSISCSSLAACSSHWRFCSWRSRSSSPALSSISPRSASMWSLIASQKSVFGEADRK